MSPGMNASASAAEPEVPPVAPVERELSTPRAAGVAGILFSALFLLADILLRAAMGRSLSAQQIVRNLSGHNSTLAVAGLYVMPFAGIAFLWFMAVLRDRIGRREDKFFATVFLGSGLLFIALFLAGGAAAGGLVAGERFGTTSLIDVATVGYARSLSYAFLLVFATKAAGVFTIVTSTILWRLARWPRWMALYGYATALVLLLSVTYFEPVILLFPAWVTVVSLYVLVTGGSPARRHG